MCRSGPHCRCQFNHRAFLITVTCNANLRLVKSCAFAKTELRIAEFAIETKNKLVHDEMRKSGGCASLDWLAPPFESPLMCGIKDTYTTHKSLLLCGCFDGTTRGESAVAIGSSHIADEELGNLVSQGGKGNLMCSTKASSCAACNSSKWR